MSPSLRPAARLIYALIPGKYLDIPTISPFPAVRLPCRNHRKGDTNEYDLLGQIAHVMTVAEAKNQFARGLAGTWSSYLGGGNDMLIGMRLTFREDGSGKMEEWGFDQNCSACFLRMISNGVM